MTGWIAAAFFIGGFGRLWRLARINGHSRISAFFEAGIWPSQVGSAIAAWAYAGKDWE